MLQNNVEFAITGLFPCKGTIIKTLLDDKEIQTSLKEIFTEDEIFEFHLENEQIFLKKGKFKDIKNPIIDRPESATTYFISCPEKLKSTLIGYFPGAWDISYEK